MSNGGVVTIRVYGMNRDYFYKKQYDRYKLADAGSSNKTMEICFI